MKTFQDLDLTFDWRAQKLERFGTSGSQICLSMLKKHEKKNKSQLGLPLFSI